MQVAEWNVATFTVKREGAKAVTITDLGRLHRALECLFKVFQKGCTPNHSPAPRWSSYIHKLRCAGVDVETETKPHAGAFAGTLARYVPRELVERVG